jgi:hypothetical protein
MPWIAERAAEGLAPDAIRRRAEEEGRESVATLSTRQIFYDLRTMRDRALQHGAEVYRAILDRTIEELSRLAFADLRSVLEWGPDGIMIRDCFELDEATAAIVSSVQMKTTTRTTAKGVVETTVEAKIDTHSKTQALRDLLRHLGGILPTVAPVDSVDADAVLDKLVDRLSRAEEPDPDEADSSEN